MPVPTQTTLLLLRSQVLTLLDEANNTEGGAFPSGSGGTDTADTRAYLTLKLNEAKNILTREAWPIEAVTTLTFPAGTKTFVFAGMTTNDGSATINCLDVTGPNGPLTLAGRSHLNRNYPAASLTSYINTSGAPVYWYRSGGSGIGLAPYPAADTPLTLNSYVVPPDMAADTDTPSWLTTDLARLLVFYAASMYARKNAGDEKIQGLADGWMADFDKGKLMLQTRFAAADPALARLILGIDSTATGK